MDAPLERRVLENGTVQFQCTCLRWCARGRWVSRSTANNHRNQRRLELQGQHDPNIIFPAVPLPNPLPLRSPDDHHNELVQSPAPDENAQLPDSDEEVGRHPHPEFDSPPPSPPGAGHQDLPFNNDPPDVNQDNHVPQWDTLPEPEIPHLKTAMDFVRALANATFENSDLPAAVKTALQEPVYELLDLDDQITRLSVDLFIASDGSRKSYQYQCTSVQRAHPEDKLLSWDKLQRRLAAWTGIHLMTHDMCINDCVGYTGPFKDLLQCPTCNENRHIIQDHKRKPRKQFWTLPVGPQLQARWASPMHAAGMKYGWNLMRTLHAQMVAEHKTHLNQWLDVWYGSDFLNKFAALPTDDGIQEHDSVIFFSTDGAQVYRNKKSNCTFSVAVILNLKPSVRYKNTELLPLAIIPGSDGEDTSRPHNMDSFNFPVFHEMACLMKEGMQIYDADEKVNHLSHLFLPLAGADGVALTALDGGVGHSGALGCRLKCPAKRRNKSGGSHYYPALQLPNHYNNPSSMHPDQDPAVLARYTPDHAAYMQNLEELLECRNTHNDREYEKVRLRTGCTKPSLFIGFPAESTLGVPGTFPLDMFHVPALNAPDLFLKLWRGTLACDTKRGDSRTDWPWTEYLSQSALWKEHGAKVASARPYLPSDFDKAPRDPAKKSNSGYKGQEWMTYLYALGPMVLQPYLPMIYWKHFCRFCRFLELVGQDHIVKKELNEADQLIRSWVLDFEILYVHRKEARLDFVRPWIHTLIHIPNEIVRIGPPSCYSQWTMERTIGLLEWNLRLHSNPYANLAHIAKRQCQLNALQMYRMDIGFHTPTPHELGIDLGHGFAALRPREDRRRPVTRAEQIIIQAYFDNNGVECDEEWLRKHSVLRWGRLGLPNGSVVRTAWRELHMTRADRRCSRMIQVSTLAGLQTNNARLTDLLRSSKGAGQK
jgi:hypothetical protein